MPIYNFRVKPVKIAVYSIGYNKCYFLNLYQIRKTKGEFYLERPKMCFKQQEHFYWIYDFYGLIEF